MTTEPTMNVGAQQYFDRVPDQWDAFYSHENRFMYTVNRLLRKGLFQRYHLTFEQCGDLTGKSVLDIGCGTGRYSIESAKRGAKRVLGIDFAPHMVEFSRKIATQMNVDKICEFACANFLEYPVNESFDVVLALGLFDYIESPEALFKKIGSLKPRVFAASFPRFTPFWGIQRKIRYNMVKKCPIYDYSETQLHKLFKAASFEDHVIIPYRRGFMGIGKNNGDRG